MKTLFNNYINTFKGLSHEVWWLALITLINRAGTMVIPFLSLYLTENLRFHFKRCWMDYERLWSWLCGWILAWRTVNR